MQSTSASDGSYTLIVTFDIGTDLDFAQVLVQNRVAQRLAPAAAGGAGAGRHGRRRSRPRSSRSSTLTSPDGRYDSLYPQQLRDDQPEGRAGAAARRRQRQRVRRRPICDADLARPGEAAGARPRSPSDVVQALQQQSAAGGGRADRHAAGTADDQSFQYTVNVLGRLDRRRRSSRTSSSRPATDRRRHHAAARRRPRRAGRADLQPVFNARRQAGGGHRHLPAARRQRARRRDARSRAQMQELAASFPPGLDYAIPFDTTTFVHDVDHARSTRR